MKMLKAVNNVYVKTDSKQSIISINSDSFIKDIKGWIKIDEGYGDKYHHAQNNYFDKPILTENFIPRYKLVDGVAAERTQEEIDGDYTPPTTPVSENERLTVIENLLMDMLLKKEGGASVDDSNVSIPATDVSNEATDKGTDETLR